MVLNYVICSYAGMYPRRYQRDPLQQYQYYLRYHLMLLDSLDCSIDIITIMRPQVDPEHTEITAYYDFDTLPLRHIRDKIRIIDCENLGLSYGQFLYCLEQDRQQGCLSDYYIFTEDDYIPSQHHFDRILIANYQPMTFLCLGVNKKPDGQFHLGSHNDSEFVVPDFSIGIIDRQTVEYWYKKLPWNVMYHSFMMQKEQFTLHQVLFGYFLHVVNLQVKDTNAYLSVFYEVNCKVYLINFNRNYRHITRTRDPREIFRMPLFLPLDILPPNDYREDVKIIGEYLGVEKKAFDKMYEYLCAVKKGAMKFLN